MTTPDKHLRTCKNGHSYYKSSDCPTCPICEQARSPREGFLALLGAPARRALENKGITTLEQLSGFSESEILALHGDSLFAASAPRQASPGLWLRRSAPDGSPLPGGALSTWDRRRRPSNPTFYLPGLALSPIFRAKFRDG